jgi:hypothetical protein
LATLRIFIRTLTKTTSIRGWSLDIIEDGS